MEKLKVKIKKLHPDAKMPFYAKPGDAGMDLTAVSKKYDDYGNVHYGFGLAFEIPEGYVGLIFPRSSCAKFDLSLSNCVGVIDSGYRSEVSAKFKPALMYNTFHDKDLPAYKKEYEVGDRVAQIIIMPYPQVEFEEAEELSETERGTGGYGHTGLK